MSDPFRTQYRELSEGEKQTLASLKEKASELYDIFEQVNTPHIGREIAVAKTKLEESVMWAVKGITGPIPLPSSPVTTQAPAKDLPEEEDKEPEHA
jgi:hypothetical protein